MPKARRMWAMSGRKWRGFRCRAERPLRIRCSPRPRASNWAVTVAMAAPATPQPAKKMKTGSRAALISTLATITRKAKRTSPMAWSRPWMAMKPNSGTMPK